MQNQEWRRSGRELKAESLKGDDKGNQMTPHEEDRIADVNMSLLARQQADDIWECKKIMQV